MAFGIPGGIRERAKELLSMFLADPQTNDHLGAIVEWRIPQYRAALSVEQVSEAVDFLVAERFLIAQEINGQLHYRLNSARVEEARRFVAGQAAASEPRRHPLAVDGPTLSHAIRWIDATLLCFLCRTPEDEESHSLTRSQKSIKTLVTRRLFGGDVSVDDGCADDAACAAVGPAAEALRKSIAAADNDDPLAGLITRLSLQEIESHALLLCLAPELDPVYQLVYGVLNDDMSRRTPTLALLCSVLGDPLAVRDQLTQLGALARWRVFEHGPSLPHADESLLLDRSIVSWLLGDAGALLDDPHLRGLVRREPWPGATWLRQPDDLIDVEAMRHQFASDECRQVWLILVDGDTSIWRALAEAAAAAAGACLTRILVPGLAASPDPVDAAVRLARATLLLQSIAVIDRGDAGTDDDQPAAVVALATLTGSVAGTGRAGVVIVPELDRVTAALPRESVCIRRRPRPSEATLATAYSAAAADAGLYLDAADAGQLARSFPLSLAAIEDAVRLAVLEGALDQPTKEQAESLLSASRRIASPDLPRFARRVRPAFTLDDLVLPTDRRAQLDEIVAHVRHASQVLQTWGFGAQLPYGRGVAALFTGPSGTGKTMAAQGIAHALRTDAFILDLSRVMSKFVGESEKYIDAAVRDAERAGAVLQIDEADALFAKRTETKDSHDRYANLLVSFLLYRMETFEGVAILTTNFGRTVDQAFLRRLRFIVEFPRPDAQAREAIWRRCLPPDAPLRDDINLRFLARRFELSGGNIRSITLRAAFLAAAEGAERIAMRHLIAATRAELLKLGMAAAERELAEFELSQRPSGSRVA